MSTYGWLFRPTQGKSQVTEIEKGGPLGPPYDSEGYFTHSGLDVKLASPLEKVRPDASWSASRRLDTLRGHLLRHGMRVHCHPKHGYQFRANGTLHRRLILQRSVIYANWHRRLRQQVFPQHCSVLVAQHLGQRAGTLAHRVAVIAARTRDTHNVRFRLRCDLRSGALEQVEVWTA